MFANICHQCIRSLTRMSNLHWPMVRLKEGSKPYFPYSSKSHRLMMDLGLISFASKGLFHLLPITQLALDKLVVLVDREMKSIGAQKVTLSSLIPLDLWKRTGRYDTCKDDLFHVADREGMKYCLGPTHEEAVTELFKGPQIKGSRRNVSERRLPLYLYQITTKFRNEEHPRYGLLRTREFLMKDLYTFDASETAARVTYDIVCEAYQRLFDKLGLGHIRKVQAACGAIGGSMSHEFHLPCDSGEDYILMCRACGEAWSEEFLKETSANDTDDFHGTCKKCGTPNLTRERTIESAHAFHLGTRYSSCLHAFFQRVNAPTDDSATFQPVDMGCYGIGITRLLASAIESLSPNVAEIRWPRLLAPFDICIIPPKAGSKEAPYGTAYLEPLITTFESRFPNLSLLLDDRTDLTIGWRFREAGKLGCPLTIVIGGKAGLPIPLFEVRDLDDPVGSQFVTHNDLCRIVARYNRSCYSV